MYQDQCIFCSIINRQAKSFIVYEDEFSVAFLDIMPRSKGMTIVVPKNHYANFEDDMEMSAKVFLSAEKIAYAIKKSLNPITVFISVIPSQVQHFHIKIYPVYRDEIPLIENQPKEANESELLNIAQIISSSIPKQKVEEESKKPKIEKVEEEKKKARSKEETYWIRREIEIA
jgi:histidine triad (HIT) family protein